MRDHNTFKRAKLVISQWYVVDKWVTGEGDIPGANQLSAGAFQLAGLNPGYIHPGSISLRLLGASIIYPMNINDFIKFKSICPGIEVTKQIISQIARGRKWHIMHYINTTVTPESHASAPGQ